MSAPTARRVTELISNHGWRKNGTSRAPRTSRPPKPQILGELGRGLGVERGQVGTDAAPRPQKRASGPISAPPDLLEFVGGLPEREAARVLGLSKGSVGRLRQGYWPDDPRKVLQAWERYKASRGVVASGWFLRRVYLGGLVRHAGQAYTATGLAARTGQLLAVSRATDGGLLAQTLDLPAERMSLWPAPLIAE